MSPRRTEVTKTKIATPEPVPVNVVCSLCGESWHLHNEVDGEVTTLECIRLLRARAPQIIWRDRWNPITWPYTITQPYTSPYYTTASGTVTSSGIKCSNETPRVLTANAA